MCFHAFSKGALKVTGVDNNSENIRVCNLINDYLHYSCDFSVMDVDSMNSISGYDVIFCLSINHWVKDKLNLYDNLDYSGASVIYWESNDGPLNDSVLKNYDLFFVAAVAETIQKIDSLFDDLTSKKDREDEIHSIDYFKLVSLDD